MQKKTVRPRWLIILTVLTVAFIWGNSLLPAEVSGAISDRVSRFLADALGLALDTAQGHGMVRKLAHGTEYLVLGLELTALLRPGRETPKSLTALLGLGTAFLDETIQLFVFGRSGEIRDVWIDLGGFCVGCLLMALILWNRKKHRPA